MSEIFKNSKAENLKSLYGDLGDFVDGLDAIQTVGQVPSKIDFFDLRFNGLPL